MPVRNMAARSQSGEPPVKQHDKADSEQIIQNEIRSFESPFYGEQ